MKQTMQSFNNSLQKFGLIAVICFTLSIIYGLPAHGQDHKMTGMTPTPTPTPMPKMAGMKSKDTKMPDADTMPDMEDEIPHAFFTHEGLPDAVGTFALRTSGVILRADGTTKGDFGFHLETGLTKRIGLHIRNDRVLNSDHTEVMFQFAAITSKDGKNGFAPILEFEFPTRKGAGSRVNVLVGFSTKFSNSRAAFNSVIHFNPREHMVESNMSLVFKATPRFYPIFEVLAEGGRGMSPIVTLVGGFKIRMNKSWLLGFGFQAPTTRNRDFSAEGVFQSENMFMWKR